MLLLIFVSGLCSQSGRHRKEVDYTVDGSEDELMGRGFNTHHDDETTPGNDQFVTDKHDEMHVTSERLVQENASSDYLMTGGGFCADEDDTDQAHNSCDIPREETEAQGEPKSYQTNQGERNQSTAGPVSVEEYSSVATDKTEQRKDGSHTRRETDSGDAKTKHDSGSTVTLEGSSGNDPLPPLAAYGSLRAMPMLRRKRRKT